MVTNQLPSLRQISPPEFLRMYKDGSHKRIFFGSKKKIYCVDVSDVVENYGGSLSSLRKELEAEFLTDQKQLELFLK